MNEIRQLQSDVESIRTRINNLPTRDYLYRHLSTVYWELDRLAKLSESRELSLLATNNGGHIGDGNHTQNAHYDRD